MTNEEFIKSISLEGEEWRDVVGFEGHYVVSNLGRIATLAHEVDFVSYYEDKAVKKKYRAKQHLRKLNLNKYGYIDCTLRDGGKRYKLLKVHRIVAEAFIPNPNNLSLVNHKDENKTNNRADNLEWCNDKYNNNYGTRNERLKASLSKAHQNGLYDNANKMCRRPIIGISLYDNSTIIFERSADMHAKGFERHLVSQCCRNLRQDYKGYKWMYLSDYESLINMSKNS